MRSPKPKPKRCRSVIRWETGIDVVRDYSARCVLPQRHRQKKHKGLDPETNKMTSWAGREA